MTALITPFRDGRPDEAAFRAFIDWQIAEGAEGLVPCGTTGESATLSHPEHMRAIEICLEATARRVPVIAGTGSNSTEEAIVLTRHAEKAGADAALLITPYYNKPTQEGLYQHFKAVHDATRIPLILYNVPSRTAVDMAVATLARLAELPRIAGVKDATADLARPLRLRRLIKREFSQLSGEDATVVPFLAHGGVGCISVTANIAPRLCAELHRAWRAGDAKKALALNETLLPLHDAMFVETNPIPVKYAVSLLGRCSGEIRLPLTPPSEASRKVIEGALREAGLIA